MNMGRKQQKGNIRGNNASQWTHGKQRNIRNSI